MRPFHHRRCRLSISRLPTSLDSAHSDVRAAIGAAAQRTGVDFSYLLAQAKSESGLNPTAKASGSSASGLFQFLDQSWLAILKRHGSEQGYGWAADAISPRAGGGFTVDPGMRSQVMALRDQAAPSALMAAAYARDNADGIGQALGRTANAADLYFAHFLGLAGAKRFLRAADASPGATAAALFPKEAQANRSIFYARDGGARSLGEVYQLMARKLASAGASEQIEPPGTLVRDPADATASALQLAATDTSDTSDTASAGGDGVDMAATLSALSQARMDVLRPTPAQAKLAYLMLSMPLA